MTRRAVWTAVLAGVIVWNFPVRPLRALQAAQLEIETYTALGEAFLHRLATPTSISYRMPLSGLIPALLFTHDATALSPRAAIALLLLALLGLLTALSRSLLPAALFSLAGPPLYDHLQLAFTLFVLLAAAALLRWARRPTSGRAALLGAALGASLLMRSSLALFAPLLALYEGGTALRRNRRPPWRRLALLLAVPALFLVPWSALNARLHGRFIPFEDGQASSNLVAGALGLTRTVEGDWSRLIDDPAVARADGAAVAAWAVREAASHPLRTARAVAARLLYALSLDPWLYLLAAAGLWLRRRRPDARRLALFGGYFLGIHCLPAAQENYFLPLRALATLAAAPAIERALGVGAPAGRFAARLSRAGLNAAFALALALALLAEVAILRYDRPESPEAALDAAISAAPREAGLRLPRAQSRLARGNVAGAQEDFTAALRLAPHAPRAALYAAWARSLHDPAYTAFPPEPANEDSRLRWERRLLEAHVLSRAGRAADARLLLWTAAEARAAWPLVRGSTPAEIAARDALSAAREDALPRDIVRHPLLAARPPGELIALLRALEDLRGPSPALSLELAELSAKAGDHAAVRRLLGKVGRFSGAEEASRVAALFRGIRDHALARGDVAAALAAQAELAELSPHDHFLRLEAAALAARAGNRAEALAYLESAASTARFEERLKAALLLQDLKEYPRALASFARLTAERPQDASLLAAQGLCRYLAGDAAGAVADLESALARDPRQASAAQTLGTILASQGRRAQAYRVFDAALRSGASQDADLKALLEEGRRESAAKTRR